METLPIEVGRLVQLYAKQLQNSGETEEKVAEKKRELINDFYEGLDEALGAGHTLAMATDYAIENLKSRLPTESAKDPFRESWLADMRYVLLGLWPGLIYCSLEYHVFKWLYDPPALTLGRDLIYISYWQHTTFPLIVQVSFTLAMLIKTFRLQPYNMRVVFRQCVLVSWFSPSNWRRKLKDFCLGMTIAGTCLFLTINLGFLAILMILSAAEGFFDSLEEIKIESVRFWMYFVALGCALSLYCSVFYVIGGLVDTVLRVYITPILIRVAVVPGLRFLRS